MKNKNQKVISSFREKDFILDYFCKLKTSEKKINLDYQNCGKNVDTILKNICSQKKEDFIIEKTDSEKDMIEKENELRSLGIFLHDFVISEKMNDRMMYANEKMSLTNKNHLFRQTNYVANNLKLSKSLPKSKYLQDHKKSVIMPPINNNDNEDLKDAFKRNSFKTLYGIENLNSNSKEYKTINPKRNSNFPKNEIHKYSYNILFERNKFDPKRSYSNPVILKTIMSKPIIKHNIKEINEESRLDFMKTEFVPKGKSVKIHNGNEKIAELMKKYKTGLINMG